MKNQPTPRTHTPDEPPPATIHHPEDDQTLLARWLSHASEKGANFWLTIGGIVAAAIAVGYFASGYLGGSSATSRAWSEVLLATSPEDLRQIAASNESTPAAGWALLGAAAENYGESMKYLPTDRVSGLALLTKAFDTYKQVADAPESDDLLKRMAILGMARSLEARGELSDAIVQYERVAKDFPGTEDAKRAEDRVKTLGTPEAKEFYAAFSAFKPRSNSGVLPPRGSMPFDFNGPFGSPLPSGHPPVDGPMIPAPALEKPLPELPANPFAPTDAKPKDEPAKPK